jgi:Na+/proline symporter
MLGAIPFIVALMGGGFSEVGEVFSKIGKEFTDLPSLLVNRPYSREFLSYFVLLTALILVEVMEERWNLWPKLRVRPAWVRWAVYYAVALVVIGLGSWRPMSFVYQSF